MRVNPPHFMESFMEVYNNEMLWDNQQHDLGVSEDEIYYQNGIISTWNVMMENKLSIGIYVGIIHKYYIYICNKKRIM
jgi:hypothetical protein